MRKLEDHLEHTLLALCDRGRITVRSGGLDETGPDERRYRPDGVWLVDQLTYTSLERLAARGLARQDFLKRYSSRGEDLELWFEPTEAGELAAMLREARAVKPKRVEAAVS